MATRTQREEFAMTAILKQLELANVNPSVLKEDKAWYSNNTITPEKHSEWRTWFIAEARKVFKLTKKAAEKEFGWFSLSYGLRETEA